MPKNTKKGRYSSKKYPCPICKNITGSCKSNDDGSIYCYHSSPDFTPTGYVHVRELSNGMGHEFIQPHIVDELLRAVNILENNHKTISNRKISHLTGFPSSWITALKKAYPCKFHEWNNFNYPNSQEKKNIEVAFESDTVMENFPQPSNPQILDEEERDRQYREIFKQIQLNKTHHYHLQQVRGLGEYSEFIGFRSWESMVVQNVSPNLPGVIEKNGLLYLYGQKGLFLPIYNEIEQIIGFQIRPDNQKSGKYKWGSSAPANGQGPRLNNDEMPLAFCRPPSIQISSVGLAEGVLKAWSVACNLGQIIIGAPGATWDCSPKLLKRYLKKIVGESNLNLSNLVLDLYVDAGMLSNHHIMLRYYKTVELLKQWECQVRIGWWNQLTKNDPDIDDLIIQGNRQQITYISVDEWMGLWSDEIRNYLLDKPKQFDTSDWSSPIRHPHKSELGYWKSIKSEDGRTEYSWIPKAGFSFTIEKELVGNENNCGGLVLRVKRTYDSANQYHQVIVPAESLNKVTDFINCLSYSTGKVYFVNKLKIEELHKYLHKELSAYRVSGGKAYKLSERMGRQDDDTWIFYNCQISSDGSFITEEKSGWVLDKTLIAKEKIPIPTIHLYKKPEAFRKLINSMRKFFGEQRFIPALFTVAFSVAGLFYDQIQEQEGFFPVLGIYGDAGGGKTLAAQTAQNLLGFNNRAKIHKISESAYYQRFKLMGGLTQFIDDPDKAQIQQIAQQIKTQFGAGSRFVRENNQDSHSALIVASNYSIGDDDPIILSRLIRLQFQGSPNSSAFSELREHSCISSCYLPELIKIGYPRKEVKDLESHLINKLSSAHSRLAVSLAIVGYYAFKISEISGVVHSSEVRSYLDLLCEEANCDKSNKSSLDDFIDKLCILHSQTEIGEWNCRLITEDGNIKNGHYKSLAVYLHGIWSLMSRYFKDNLPYSQKMIRQQVERMGGKSYSKQKFHLDKDSSITYQRLKIKIQANMNSEIVFPKTPEMVTRSCIEIPIELLEEKLDNFL